MGAFIVVIFSKKFYVYRKVGRELLIKLFINFVRYQEQASSPYRLFPAIKGFFFRSTNFIRELLPVFSTNFCNYCVMRMNIL